jgi:hypothetical protein
MATIFNVPTNKARPATARCAAGQLPLCHLHQTSDARKWVQVTEAAILKADTSRLLKPSAIPSLT